MSRPLLDASLVVCFAHNMPYLMVAALQLSRNAHYFYNLLASKCLLRQASLFLLLITGISISTTHILIISLFLNVIEGLGRLTICHFNVQGLRCHSLQVILKVHKLCKPVFIITLFYCCNHKHSGLKRK